MRLSRNSVSIVTLAIQHRRILLVEHNNYADFIRPQHFHTFECASAKMQPRHESWQNASLLHVDMTILALSVPSKCRLSDLPKPLFPRPRSTMQNSLTIQPRPGSISPDSES
jgi:hypothetical protein